MKLKAGDDRATQGTISTTQHPAPRRRHSIPLLPFSATAFPAPQRARRLFITGRPTPVAFASVTASPSGPFERDTAEGQPRKSTERASAQVAYCRSGKHPATPDNRDEKTGRCKLCRRAWRKQQLLEPGRPDPSPSWNGTLEHLFALGWIRIEGGHWLWCHTVTKKTQLPQLGGNGSSAAKIIWRLAGREPVPAGYRVSHDPERCPAPLCVLPACHDLLKHGAKRPNEIRARAAQPPLARLATPALPQPPLTTLATLEKPGPAQSGNSPASNARDRVGARRQDPTDYTGSRFGSWTVLHCVAVSDALTRRPGTPPGYNRKWVVRCDCGRSFERTLHSIVEGQSRRCSQCKRLADRKQSHQHYTIRKARRSR